MYRSNLILISVVTTLMFAGGCAKKNLQTEAVVPAEPVAATKIEEPVAVQVQEPVAAAPITLDVSALKTVYFDYDSHKLSPAAMDKLRNNAEMIQADRSFKVTIEGHCDERGSDEYNISLGELRAREVMTYLASIGIGKDRLSVVSYGEERPADEGNTREAWAKNRRVEFNT